MKTNKTKPQKKTTKKAVKKQIEQSLTDRFLEAVKGLGHNAELIADDVAKLSKAAAKKLSKKFKEVKQAVSDKIDDAKATKKPVAKKVKLAKKDASKLVKKVDKTVSKVVKKAVSKAKPLATSVKVEGIATAEKAAAAIKAPIKKAPVKRAPAQKVAPKTEVMENKSAADAKDNKTAAVKAVANNPVKKVSDKAVPTKKNTTTKK